MYEVILKTVACLFSFLLAGILARYRKQRKPLSLSWTELLCNIKQLIFMFRADASTGMMKMFPLTPNLFKYFGVSTEECATTGIDAMSYIHPDDHKQACIEAYDCIADHRPYKFQKRTKGPGGVYRWTRTKSSFIRNEDHVSVWLGVMDDITDLQQLCDELERSRAMSRAFERVLSATFDKLVYVDRHLRICTDLPHQATESIADWFISNADRALLESHISKALGSETRPLPVMMEADLQYSVGLEACRHQVFIVNMPLTGAGRVLVGIKEAKKRSKADVHVGDLSVIEIPVEGDITELVGFFYSILDEETRERFTQVWKRQVLEDCLSCLESTRLGNLNVLSSQPLATSSAGLIAVFMFIALAALKDIPCVDRVSVFMHASERVASLADKDIAGRASFYLAMSAMKMTGGSASPRMASALFETATDLLTQARFEGAVHMLTILRLQRGLYTWLQLDSAVEARSWFLTAAGTDNREIPMSGQIKAVVLYDAFLLHRKEGEEKGAHMKLFRLQKLVSSMPGVEFDSGITRLLSRMGYSAPRHALSK